MEVEGPGVMSGRTSFDSMGPASWLDEFRMRSTFSFSLLALKNDRYFSGLFFMTSIVSSARTSRRETCVCSLELL